MLRQAEALAKRVKSVSNDDESRVRSLFQNVFGRDPSTAELADWAPYEKKHGTANLGRLLMNGSEFLFVD